MRRPHNTLLHSLAGAKSVLFMTSMLAWATVFHGTAIGVRHASPIMFSAFRTLLPLVVMLVLLKLGLIRLPRPKLALIAALSGLLMVAGFSYAMVDSIALAGAGNSAVIANSQPLWIAFLSMWILRDRLSRRALAGVLVGFGGLVLMFSSELHVSGGDVAKGMAIGIAGAAGYSVATIAIKLVSNRDEHLDPLGVMTLQYLAGSPVLFVLGFATQGVSGTAWSSPSFWGASLFVGLMSLVGSTAYVMSLQRRTATQSSLVFFLVPVVALAIEVALGHKPDVTSFAGMAVVIVAVGLVTSKGTGTGSRLKPLPRSGAMGRGVGLSPAMMHAAVAPEAAPAKVAPTTLHATELA